MDKRAVADIQADMGGRGAVAAVGSVEEHEVARLEIALRDGRTVAQLTVRAVGQAVAELCVDVHREAGAVEPAGGCAAVDIADAEIALQIGSGHADTLRSLRLYKAHRALAADGVLHTGNWVWAVIIGALIIVWIFIGLTNLGRLNTVAMAALFILSLVLFKVIFFNSDFVMLITASDDTMTFGAAVELAVAMPLSWLPLISDYTREAEKPFAATLASVLVYSLVSIFMYMIGMGAAIFTGEYDIAQIMLKTGFGVVGLLIIVFSTVTTTFLDAYSAGVSSVSISSKIQEKWAAIVVTVIGTAAAIVYPMDNITNFLYLIGSVFAPMIAVQIADYFILKKADAEKSAFQWRNLVVWLAGFMIYRILMQVDTPVGNTLPDMVITVILCLIVEKAAGASHNRKRG